MSKSHLFSASLFDTLFQHNLISSDGYVKASDDQILAFRQFLVNQARNRTTNLYKIRKEMVDEACILLKQDMRTQKDTRRLVMILHQLNLKITREGILESEDPGERKHDYLGTSEPNKSTWEKQLLAEEKRLEVLRRDLKELEDWLGEIGKPGTKVRKHPIKPPEDSKKDEMRYRARTEKRNMDMDRARRRLILKYDAENAKSVKRTLAHKAYPGRVHFEKNASVATDGRKESDESYLTAASQFSFLLRPPLSVTPTDMELARSAFDSCEEDHSILRVKKSKATEKLLVQPGIQWSIDEDMKFRPIENITTFVSEPTMEISEHGFVAAMKTKRYSSDTTLDGKSSSIGPTIDEAKQYIVIYGDQGMDTEYKVEDEKIKQDKLKLSGETYDKRPKSILKVSRKSKIMPPISSENNKRPSKESSMDYKDHKNRPQTKRQIIQSNKGEKASSSSSVRRQKVPEIAQGIKHFKPVRRKKDGNKANIENKGKIIGFNDTNKGKRNIFKTGVDEVVTKHQTGSQVEGNLLGGSITPKDGKKPLKEHPVEKKDSKNGPTSERKSIEYRKEGETTNSSLKRKNVQEITRGEKSVKPDGQNRDKNKAKIDNKQKSIDSTDNNIEMGGVLKTMDAKDENKLRAKRRPNLTSGKVVNKNHDGLRDKNVKDRPEIESKRDEVLSRQQQLSLEKDFKTAQLTEKNKMTVGNQEKTIDSVANSKKKRDISKSDNEHSIDQQSKLKAVAKNKNEDKPRDKNIKGLPESKSKEKQEKVIDFKENGKKKEDGSTKDNIDGQLKLKETAKKNKKDDDRSDKAMKTHAGRESKEDQGPTKGQHLILEKDFHLAQGKRDPKTKREESVAANDGFEENINDFKEERKQKDNNVKPEKEIKSFPEKDLKDSKDLTLDQQLRRESSRKGKEMRKMNLKESSSQNDGDINHTKNDAGMSDSFENAELVAEGTNPEESPKEIDENKELTLDQQLSNESENSFRKRRQKDSKLEDHDNKHK